MDATEIHLRERLCRIGASLFDRGLTAGSSGNLSVRLPDGGWLATPTNCSLGRLDPARLSRLDADGRLLAGDAPTKELPLHAAVYRARPGAQAVVHLHCAHCTAVSMLRDADPASLLPPLTAYQLMKLGRVPRVPWFRPGDPAVAPAVEALAAKHPAILLANHGPVVAGDSLEAAADATEELEATARLYLLLEGRPANLLTPAQIDELRRHAGAQW